jgi:hypothetical protein
MDKVLIDIRKEDDIIVNLFQGKDLVTVDDLLNKLVELQEDGEYLKEELEEERNKRLHPEYYEEDRYEDYKLGLLG